MKTLDLSFNRVGDRGAGALAAMLVNEGALPLQALELEANMVRVCVRACVCVCVCARARASAHTGTHGRLVPASPTCAYVTRTKAKKRMCVCVCADLRRRLSRPSACCQGRTGALTSWYQYERCH